MKHVKEYENKITTVEKGEYVLLKITNKHFHVNYYNYLENNIGKVTNVEYYSARIEYENIPENLIQNFKNNCITSDMSYIYKHSHNKEDLEIYIDANNYNL